MSTPHDPDEHTPTLLSIRHCLSTSNNANTLYNLRHEDGDSTDRYLSGWHNRRITRYSRFKIAPIHARLQSPGPGKDAVPDFEDRIVCIVVADVAVD